MTQRPLRALAKDYAEGRLGFAEYRASRGDLLDAALTKTRSRSSRPPWYGSHAVVVLWVIIAAFLVGIGLHFSNDKGAVRHINVAPPVVHR